MPAKRMMNQNYGRTPVDCSRNTPLKIGNFPVGFNKSLSLVQPLKHLQNAEITVVLCSQRAFIIKNAQTL